jgi:hypothetical protein
MNSETNEVAEVKTPKFCEKDYTDEGVAEFKFGNGTVVMVNASDLSEDIRNNLMMHGLMQKIGDSYASARGDFTIGVAAAEKVIQQLMDGQWTASRASGESKPKIGELVTALANLKGLDATVVATAVEKATDDQRKAWRKHPAIAAEIAKIRAEKAAARAKAAVAEGGDIEL